MRSAFQRNKIAHDADDGGIFWNPQLMFDPSTRGFIWIIFVRVNAVRNDDRFARQGLELFTASV